MVHKSNVVIKAALAATAGLMLLVASNDIRLAEPDTWVSQGPCRARQARHPGKLCRRCQAHHEAGGGDRRCHD